MFKMNRILPIYRLIRRLTKSLANLLLVQQPSQIRAPENGQALLVKMVLRTEMAIFLSGFPRGEWRHRGKESDETSALLDSVLKEEFGHAYLRYCRDKAWEVDDLADIRLAKDGSVRCVVRWKPTEVKSTALVGEKLQKRLEEMFEKKYGVDKWVRWSVSQASLGRC